MNKFLIIFSVFLLLSTKAISQDSYILNYEEVDIRALSQDVSRFTGKVLILDPRVNGRITIYSDVRISEEEVWDVFLRTIQVNGFSALTEENVVRIVPETESIRDINQGTVNGDITTRIIQLRNRSAEELVGMIRPIMGRQSYLSSISSINALLVVDVNSNISRVEELIMSLDISSNAEITIYPLENLSVIEAVRILESLKTQNNANYTNFTVIPFLQSNSVIISASNFVTNNIKEALERLDRDALGESPFGVIYLRYAKAEEIASILQTLAPRLVSGSLDEAPVITFHAETNAIIISADPSVTDQLRNLIARLDLRRAQVLVEAVVVELSDTAAQTLGIETIFLGDGEDRNPGFITRFPELQGPDLLAIAGSGNESGNALLDNTATNSLLGASGLIAGITRVNSGGDAFGAILNVVSQDINSNILSTPSVIAMDNEEANLVIGQEIPITTGESLGSSNTNPFRTTNRQEVGIKLSITPQINEGNSVILDIRQEVSGVAGSIGSSVDLITNIRSIETKVLVDDNQVVVLGGLIDEDIQENISKVPFLGSIPLLGRLFTSTSETVVRRNLMVFIRPRILIDASQVSEISLEKYNFLEAQRLLNENATSPIDLRNSIN